MKKRFISTFMALFMVFSLVYAFPHNIVMSLTAYADAGFYYPLQGDIIRSSSVTTNGYYCDYAAASGSPVYAPCAGTVEFRQTYAVNYDKLASYGNNFEFTSSNGVYRVRGAHLSSFNGVSLTYTSSLSYPCSASKYSCSTITLATKNVNQGDLIGYTGMTGNASGPHIHLEVYKNGSPVNPASVFETWDNLPDVNQTPVGHVDEIEGWNGKIHVRGWAFDPDNSSESLQIHVYIGGQAGSVGLSKAIVANVGSSDVNNAYGIAGSHRFDAWIDTGTRGDQPVYIYAINNEGGHNPIIGSGNAYISTSLPNDFHAMIVHSGSNKPIMQNDSGNVVLTSESRTNYDATLWHIMANGDGSYSIYSHKNGSRHGKALTVNGYSDSDGTKLICNTNSSNNGQKFKIISRSSDGTFKLVPLSSKSSDRCLELANGSTSDGTPVQIRTANGTAPQKFEFRTLNANKDKIDYKLSADKTSVAQGTSVTITVGGTTPYVVDYEFHIIAPDGKETKVDNGCNPVYTFKTEKTGNYKVYAILNNLVCQSDPSAAKNKAITINSYTPNRDPVGHVDEISGGAGKIHIRGWAYDPDNMSKSLKIHVYIGGKAGSVGKTAEITADAESTDLNGVTGKHRFDAWINTDLRGDQPVYIYAINSEGGYNPIIGSKTVTIDEINHDPVGYLERVEFENGKIRVKGWAYDPDDSSKSLPIHVYIGGKASSGAECHVIKSAIERSDVNSYYKISGIHGFDEWMETSAWGETPVYVYAINNEGGYNPCIGNGTVTVDKLESFNDDPNGAVDRIEGDKGKIHVKGWAYDPDCNGKSLQIHVYIGGKAGSGAHCYCITADVERPDINSYRRIPGDHGFDAWIETPVYGEQPVYIYAINNEGGNNPCIGNGTVTIEKTESDTNLTIYYNANGGSTNNPDYSIASSGGIYRSGSMLNEIWADGYGHINGLCNASTLGLYREGYEFMGWSLTPDADRIFGEDEKITSNDLYPNIDKADASIELYARWKAISATENNYPVVSYDLSYSSRQFRLKWTAVDGAEKYGIAVYQSGGWRVKVQVNSNTTTYTSPKMKSGSYKMVVCAKVNGEWDTSKIKSRAFTVEIK